MSKIRWGVVVLCLVVVLFPTIWWFHCGWVKEAPHQVVVEVWLPNGSQFVSLKEWEATVWPEAKAGEAHYYHHRLDFVEYKAAFGDEPNQLVLGPKAGENDLYYRYGLKKGTTFFYTGQSYVPENQGVLVGVEEQSPGCFLVSMGRFPFAAYVAIFVGELVAVTAGFVFAVVAACIIYDFWLRPALRWLMERVGFNVPLWLNPRHDW